jgi:hypothetical protein
MSEADEKAEERELWASLSALPPITKERLWNMRTQRLARLLALKAPECIIEGECINVLRVNGLYRAVWQHLYGKIKLEVWFWVKCQFWWKIVLRKSEKEIDELIS